LEVWNIYYGGEYCHNVNYEEMNYDIKSTLRRYENGEKEK
jgi:hypothetical protein